MSKWDGVKVGSLTGWMVNIPPKKERSIAWEPWEVSQIRWCQNARIFFLKTFWKSFQICFSETKILEKKISGKEYLEKKNIQKKNSGQKKCWTTKFWIKTSEKIKSENLFSQKKKKIRKQKPENKFWKQNFMNKKFCFFFFFFFYRFLDKLFWISWRNFLDFSTIFFWISERIFLEFLEKCFGFIEEFFGFLDEFFWISQQFFWIYLWNFLEFSTKFVFNFSKIFFWISQQNCLDFLIFFFEFLTTTKIDISYVFHSESFGISWWIFVWISRWFFLYIWVNSFWISNASLQVTRPERPKHGKDEVKQARRAQSRPVGQ